MAKIKEESSQATRILLRLNEITGLTIEQDKKLMQIIIEESDGTLRLHRRHDAQDKESKKTPRT